MRTINLALCAVLAAAAVPGLAQDSQANEEKKVERVVIVTHADKDSKPGEKREVRVHREGRGPMGEIALHNCDGEKTEINETTGKEKTKILFCGKPGMTAEERVKKLEELRSKLADGEHLGAEHRAKVEAALQEAINRARAGR